MKQDRYYIWNETIMDILSKQERGRFSRHHKLAFLHKGGGKGTKRGKIRH